MSPTNKEDLKGVYKGLNKLTIVGQKDGEQKPTGLIINFLARDTADAIPSIIANIDILSQVIDSIVVVVFENDSVDNTRLLIKEWAVSAKKNGYIVDLMPCDILNSHECHLKETHRYDNSGFYQSSIGRMAAYRNYLNDYIVSKYQPKNFGYLMITDIDLAVSLSPLGILHSIGISEGRAMVARGGKSFCSTLHVIFFDMSSRVF